MIRDTDDIYATISAFGVKEDGALTRNDKTSTNHRSKCDYPHKCFLLMFKSHGRLSEARTLQIQQGCFTTDQHMSTEEKDDTQSTKIHLEVHDIDHASLEGQSRRTHLRTLHSIDLSSPETRITPESAVKLHHHQDHSREA